jgi:hypothetical protein
MEHNSYYDGLSDAELYQNSWLIVAAELLWYCESRNVDYIRYTKLKTRSNEVLNLVSKGERPDFGGSFDSIMNSRRYGKFWQVNKISKNEARIFPNIPEIQNEFKCRKTENFDSRNKRILRIINQVDTVHAKRSMIGSLSVSDGLEVRVKRANPDEKSN